MLYHTFKNSKNFTIIFRDLNVFVFQNDRALLSLHLKYKIEIREIIDLSGDYLGVFRSNSLSQKR